jgi:hypothetical protein
MLKAGKVVAVWMGAALLAVLTYQAWVLPGKITGELTAIHAEVRNAIWVTPDLVLKPTLKQIDAVVDKIESRIDSIQKDTKAVVEDALGKADAQVGEVVGIAKQLQADLRPSLTSLNETTKNVASITWHVNDALPPFTDCYYTDESGEIVGGNESCVFNRFQGMTKAAEKTMQSVQLVARDVQKAVPAVLVTTQKIGDNSDLATQNAAAAAEETRRVMKNLADATQPLPKWLRYTFGVMGVVAPSVGGAVSTAAAVGAFR